MNMKKIIVILLLVITIPALAIDSAGISPLVEKFSSTFPHAQNVKWYWEGDKAEVYYTTGDIQCHLWYDAAGNVTKTRRYYNEKDLAPFLKESISSRFPDKKIFGITEVVSGDETCYVVVLEDSKRWTYVKCDGNGGMMVTKRFKKAV